MVDGPPMAITQLLTLGSPVVGRGDALELLLPCCIPAVRWQREKGKLRQHIKRLVWLEPAGPWNRRQQTPGPKPVMPELATHNRDLHLEAVGNPGDLKALDFKVYPDSGLVVTVKDIFAKPAGAKEVVREAAWKLHS